MKTSSKKFSTAVIIPFHNEEKFLRRIIERTLEYADNIIAVNDGSTDNSATEIPQKDNIHIITFDKNRGKGTALNAGFEKAVQLKVDYTITLDADFQHPPEYIPEFIKAAPDYDIVVGNRKKERGVMPLQRIASNKITSALLSMKVGQKIHDSQCGYRLYHTDILPDILPKSSGFEAESEILVFAGRKNYKIGFVPVPTIYGDENSKMKAVKAVLGFIRVFLFA